MNPKDMTARTVKVQCTYSKTFAGRHGLCRQPVSMKKLVLPRAIALVARKIDDPRGPLRESEAACSGGGRESRRCERRAMKCDGPLFLFAVSGGLFAERDVKEERREVSRLHMLIRASYDLGNFELLKIQ